MSIWRDPARVKLLRRLVQDGMSAQQIAWKINLFLPSFLHVSRSAVIGKCHRLGLKLQGKKGRPADEARDAA